MKNADKQLSQILNLDENEVEERQRLFGIDSRIATLMLGARQTINHNLDEIMDGFCASLAQFEDSGMYIMDADTLTRLRQGLGRYLLEMFSGDYSVSYVNSRLRAGLVHGRMGIRTAYYLSALRQLSVLVRIHLDADVEDAFERILYYDSALMTEACQHVQAQVLEVQCHKATSRLQQVAARNRMLEEITRQDPLTNLLNVRALNDILARELRRSTRTGQPLALLYIDLDDFKNINDTHGHGAGDEVLIRTANIMRERTRETDYLFRCGGDEFCVIAINTVRHDAEILSRKLSAAFNNAYPDYSFSIGLAEHQPGNATAPEHLLQEADRNMYLSKRTRNQELRLYTGTNN
jgi:diguanylate cyclase